MTNFGQSTDDVPASQLRAIALDAERINSHLAGLGEFGTNTGGLRRA